MAAESDRLEQDLKSPEFLHGVTQGFWELSERDGNTVYVLLHAPDGRSFLARLECSNYWDEPIRCDFVDVAERTAKPEACPDGDAQFEQWIKYRSAPFFICWDQDRAGIQHHQEWRPLKAWQKQPNEIVAYLDFLCRMLYLPAHGYNRRK